MDPLPPWYMCLVFSIIFFGNLCATKHRAWDGNSKSCLRVYYVIFWGPSFGEVGGRSSFSCQERGPSFLAREGQRPPTSSKISILKTQLLTQEAFLETPKMSYWTARTLFWKNEKYFLNRAVNPRRGCQLMPKTCTGWVLNRMACSGERWRKSVMFLCCLHPETDSRNRNDPGILINLGSAEDTNDAEIRPPHQQA